MSKPNILLVEDDPDIQQLVAYALIKAGMNVSCADRGEDALLLLEREPFAAIILDLMLPGKDGLDVCRTIRALEKTKNIPVIMLTARSDEDDIVAGLNIGADDYVTKPFSPKVLIARIRSVLRRRAQVNSRAGQEKYKTISLHGLVIDTGRHEVLYKGSRIQLTATEFAILCLLAEKAGWVFTRQQIIDRARGYEYLITPRAVDVQVFGLRKKLGAAGELIETVRGIGYRIKE
ncbi:MAG: response regulator transcription factor [Desulfobulbaceae bacterium]|nr:response regulator transcription factor [Desulfobulbaceae bacterium]